MASHQWIRHGAKAQWNIITCKPFSPVRNPQSLQQRLATAHRPYQLPMHASAMTYFSLLKTSSQHSSLWKNCETGVEAVTLWRPTQSRTRRFLFWTCFLKERKRMDGHRLQWPVDAKPTARSLPLHSDSVVRRGIHTSWPLCEMRRFMRTPAPLKSSAERGRIF